MNKRTRIIRSIILALTMLAGYSAMAVEEIKLIKVAPHTPINTDQFGQDVAVEGDVAVVGANFDDLNFPGPAVTNAGAAYVYRKIAGVWTFEQKLTAVTPGANHQFGFSVDISGTTIVVGVPVAGPGAVDVFTLVAGVWTHQVRLVDSAPAAGDGFGTSVAIDGSNLVVGIPGDGSAGGAAFFNGAGALWTLETLAAGTSPTAALFGTSVDVSGNTAVVGDPGFDFPAFPAGSGSNSGNATVFLRTGAVWAPEGAPLGTLAPLQTPPIDGLTSLATGDNFGQSVAISGDTVIVGAHLDNYNPPGDDTGSVRVFKRSAGVWSLDQYVRPTGLLTGARFGVSCALDGNVLAVGAFLDDVGAAIDAGRVVILRRLSTADPFAAILPFLQASDPNTGDHYGFRVDVDAAVLGDAVIVGANIDDGAGTDRGAAYLNSEVTPTPTPTASPTASPTPSPTMSPTASPTESPTPSPTSSPTMSPTASPTQSPTASPTPSPTASPTLSPTASPTLSPTASPTPSPTASPTLSPTASPTVSPSPTASPTQSPSASPSPTASPTMSPTESPTASPTATPTVSPTASPTPSPSPNMAQVILGYFPTNDSGHGTAYFLDNNAYSGRDRYQLRILSGTGAVLFMNEVPSLGAAGESYSYSVTLPLADANSRSWETGIRVRLNTFDGPMQVYPEKTYLGPGGGNLRHPSSFIVDFDFNQYIAPWDPPGTYASTVVDSRPTAQSNHYAYDMFRKTFGPVTETVVEQKGHGIVGSFQETFNHGTTNINFNLPVVAGEQIFYVRPRLSYRNSAGTNIGRYDIAPKSANIATETTAPPPVSTDGESASGVETSAPVDAE